MPAPKNNARTPAAEQAPALRITNFKEVALGYTEEEVKAEASRCLQCKNQPCVGGCPVGVPIPQMMAAVRDGNFAEAYRLISTANALPAISGRVCPQETQCEAKCLRGRMGEPVAIGRVERFVADWAMQNNVTNLETAPKKDKRVAIVGSGPAGLTCAGQLAKMGYGVTVFEALHTAGGVLSYGIPEFRLPKAIVRKEVANLEKMGVEIECNTVIGKTLSVDELLEDGYDAVFIGSGAGLPSMMRIPGEALIGVYTANEFLTRINLMGAYREDSHTPVLKSKKTAVIGGGNVAMDAARCARRLGAEVCIAYRRGEEELPARREEVHHAKEEGIQFELLTAPLEILGDENGRVRALRCIRMELGEPDASGRRRPVQIPGSEFELEVDTVISAIGTSPNPLIVRTTPGLETTRHGAVVAEEETGKTSREGVYAGGDIASGAATVILAMGAGKRAAAAIDEYLSAK